MIKPVTNYPSTILAAVDAVLDDLPRETLDHIASAGSDELIKMHLIVGSHLRNTLGLWTGNPDLLNACGRCGLLKTAWRLARCNPWNTGSCVDLP